MKSQNLLRKISNSIGLPLEIDQGLSSQNFQYKLPSPITSIRNFQEFIDLLEKSIPDQIDESVEDYREDNFSPDVLAYYRSFRISLSNPDEFWGIVFRFNSCKRFIQMISRKKNIPAHKVVRSAMLFVLEHEFNHYDCDLCKLMIELSRNRTGKLILTNHSCQHEESLGQTRSWKKLRRKSTSKEIVDFIRIHYESSGLKGYDDFNLYENRINEGFDEVIEHNLQRDCKTLDKTSLAHLTINQREYPRSSIPLFIEIDVPTQSKMQVKS